MSGAIIAKARAMCAESLTPDDYRNLLRKGSLSAIVSYLKDKERYRRIFSGLNEAHVNRGQAEQLLQKYLFEAYIRLCRFMSAEKSGFCYYYVKECEYKQIIDALIHLSSGNRDGYIKVLPGYLIEHLSVNLLGLARAGNGDEFLRALEPTPYSMVLAPILRGKKAEEIDVEKCVLALYKNYMRWVLKSLEKGQTSEQAKELKKIFLQKADLDNILTCYRMRKYFSADAETIRRYLKPYHYRVTDEKLMRILAEANSFELLEGLLRTDFFKGKIPFEAQNPEVSVRHYNYNFCKKQLAMTDNPTMALYSLMTLLDNECANIRKIIEGVRYGLEAAEIEHLLVM